MILNMFILIVDYIMNILFLLFLQELVQTCESETLYLTFVFELVLKIRGITACGKVENGDLAI